MLVLLAASWCWFSYMCFCSLSKPGLWLWSKHWSLWYLSHLLFLFWIQKSPKVQTKRGRCESVVFRSGKDLDQSAFLRTRPRVLWFWSESVTVGFRTGSWGHAERERGRDERVRVNMRSAVEMRMRERDCETLWHQKTIPPPPNLKSNTP